jgi:hypothetical protein
LGLTGGSYPAWPSPNLCPSLDVPENVWPLVPASTKARHAPFGDFKSLLQKVFLARESKLAAIDIVESLPALNDIYKGEVDED